MGSHVSTYYGKPERSGQLTLKQEFTASYHRRYLNALIHLSAWKVNSRKSNFRFTEFSEDEMRRPTPCAVPLEGLQWFDGL